MKSAFLINWKTTLAGILIAGEAVIQAIVTDLTSGATIPWKALIIQFVIGVGLVFAKDFNVSSVTTAASTVLLFITLPILTSCASTKTAIVSGTLSNGDKFPLCLEVTQQSPTGGVTLLAAFCAAVQTQIDTKAAEYRTLYPNATITELMGPESKKL